MLRDAYRMASGDLAHPVSTGGAGAAGQLQAALRQLCINLRAVVHDTRDQVHWVGHAAAEIRSGSHDLSARTESQASSLQQTAASMEQINGTVQASAQSARDGAQLAHDTADVSRRSHDAVSAVARTVQGITEDSRRIGDIVQVIEGVAFQTNILALNAAVEAARAGDAGRGFAVVAAEVRTLAQRTTSAAKEIKALITASTERVTEGATRSQEASERMAQALASVASVNTMLEGISAGAREQQSGISQINEAVSQLDGITQQNAALVEQLAASAQTLSSQVGAVSDSMRLFRLVPGEATVADTDAVGLRRAAREALAA